MWYLIFKVQVMSVIESDSTNPITTFPASISAESKDSVPVLYVLASDATAVTVAQVSPPDKSP